MKKNIPLIFIFIFFCIARFINLSWGNPYFYHPDERNIATSITQLMFPHAMNPQFFAYGSLPIYIIFFTGKIFQIITTCETNCTVSFTQAITISRFFSALFSVSILPLLFITGSKIKDKTTGIFTVLLAGSSIGFIQFAHFGTFEMWLSFFSLLLFYFSLHYITYPTQKYLILLSLTFGILLSIKTSSLFLSPIFLFLLLVSNEIKHKKRKLFFAHFLLKGITIFFIAFLVFFLTNPFAILDTSSFLHSLTYESQVAFGTLEVFYTQIFKDTMPIFYHLVSVFPFLTNYSIFGLFLFSFVWIIIHSIKNKNRTLLLLILFFALLFFSQAFLYVKWIRYMVVTLPFFYLILGYTLSQIYQSIQKKKKLRYYFFFFCIGISFYSLFTAYSFVLTVYFHQDTRTQAFHFAQQTIAAQSTILTEPYDLGTLPFSTYFQNITYLNVYELESDYSLNKKNEFITYIKSFDYILIPSQRILQSRLNSPHNYPLGNYYYTSLFDSSLGFSLIYQTPCTFLCATLYGKNQNITFEQTAYVFDRPTIYLFKNLHTQ